MTHDFDTILEHVYITLITWQSVWKEKKKKRQRKNGENQHGSFLEAYIHNRKSFFLESQFGNHIFTIKLYILD